MDLQPADTEDVGGVFPGSPLLSGLVTDQGLAWNEFRRRLKPNYRTVWRQITLYFAGILIPYALHCWATDRLGNGVGLALLPVAALLIGFSAQALLCFVHEAAHFNIHPDKRLNDKFANLLLCPFIGGDIARYRTMHWQHHLRLGKPEDTEISYHNAPTLRFVIETMTGIHALRVWHQDRHNVSASGSLQVDAPGVLPLLRAVVIHGLALVLPLAAGLYSSALTWVIAFAVVYPSLGAMRQLLEHRALEARVETDFRHVEHGPVNRLFGTDLFSRSFGAAGFNRHLLHHWHPSASYTCFDQLESFLRHTELAPFLDGARSTYLGTLRELRHAAVPPRTP